MKPTIGFAMCGSFCTFRAALDALRVLAERYRVIPIFSEAAASVDSRFGTARDFLARAEGICGCEALRTLAGVEPLGPKKQLDLLAVAPCTGNTLGKLACGIADGAVPFACKAHLRNARPLVLALATNDGLCGSAESLGKLLRRRHYYFVPFRQDDPQKKPYSLVADYALLPQTVEAALEGRQLQPLLCRDPAPGQRA